MLQECPPYPMPLKKGFMPVFVSVAGHLYSLLLFTKTLEAQSQAQYVSSEDEASGAVTTTPRKKSELFVISLQLPFLNLQLLFMKGLAGKKGTVLLVLRV